MRYAHEMPGYDVRAFCDILPFRLDEAKKRAGPDAKAFDDYRRILDDPDIDAVFIATPFHLHAQPLLEALDAGKHVYCEKTLVMGHEQIEKVRPVLESTDRIVQSGYQHRYSEHLRHIAGIIESGQIGSISKIECQWNRETSWRRPVPSPEYEWAVNWRMYREYSGGLTAEMSSHQMDIVQWLLDSPPRHVLGTGGIDHFKDGRTTRDNTHLLVSHECGIPVSYTTMLTNSHGGGFRMAILGTKGTLVTSLNEAWLSGESVEDDTPDDVDGMSGATMPLSGKPAHRIKLARFNATRDAVAAFQQSVISSSAPASSAIKALETSRTVQLSLDAMDTGAVQLF